MAIISCFVFFVFCSVVLQQNFRSFYVEITRKLCLDHEKTKKKYNHNLWPLRTYVLYSIYICNSFFYLFYTYFFLHSHQKTSCTYLFVLININNLLYSASQRECKYSTCLHNLQKNVCQAYISETCQIAIKILLQLNIHL